MAIRFSSFEYYKELLEDKETKKTNSAGIFIGKAVNPTFVDV